MLNFILFIKYYLYVNNIVRQTFEPSANILYKFTSKTYVDNQNSAENLLKF